jgi:electron transfer flavoprotein alpha subunit
MAVLLLAEHDNATLNGATAKALSAAKALGPVHVLVAGSGAANVAAAAAGLAGVEKVLHADAAHLANGLAEELAALIVSLMPGYDAFLAPSTARASQRCSTSCRSPTSPRSSRPTRSSGRSTPATPSRPCSAASRRRC